MLVDLPMKGGIKTSLQRIGGKVIVSIAWWSTNFVVLCGGRVRQMLFHTVGGSGTVLRDN